MSLCDELYKEAKVQLGVEYMGYGRYTSSDLDRRVLRLLCETVEKLIADLDQLRRLGV